MKDKNAEGIAVEDFFEIILELEEVAAFSRDFSLLLNEGFKSALSGEEGFGMAGEFCEGGL